MNKSDIRYSTYLNILKEELIPAMGCTEPISLAYACAKAREVLGTLPDKVLLKVSGSIIKNVKSVIVPNTGKMKGMEAAASAGIAAGNAAKELEVVSDITADDLVKIKEFMASVPIVTKHIESGHDFDIDVILYKGSSESEVRIIDNHTNICLIRKDNEVLFDTTPFYLKQQNNEEGTGASSDTESQSEDMKASVPDRTLLTLEGIWDFALTADIDDVKELLDKQISCNMALSDEGLKGDYGANIGKTLLKTYGNDLLTRAKAAAAAGSDARMNGCSLPAVINSGSGNQGIACSVPVIIYARELNAGQEKLYRALLISNLTAIHEKTDIGTLSAYCGAVNAASGAGAGISYLLGGDFDVMKHTVINQLAIVSGIVCDGAKASCAAKIAEAVDAAVLGYRMYRCGQQFRAGDGLVMNGAEATIKSIGRLGRYGMKETNNEIIRLMINA